MGKRGKGTVGGGRHARGGGSESRAVRSAEADFRSHHALKVTLAVIASLVMVLGSGIGIAGLIMGSRDGDKASTGLVAAKVMGDNVMEDSITRQIMAERDRYGSDEEWARHLEETGQTPESLRRRKIDAAAAEIILRHAMADSGLPQRVTKAMGHEWWEAVGSESYPDLDEGTVVPAMDGAIRTWALKRAKFPLDQVSDSDLLELVNGDPAKYDGARRSSHILFASKKDKSDEELLSEAEGVLARIKSGELSFDEAARQYSEDPASARRGGDVGWDCIYPLVKPYMDALRELSPGELSGIVKTEYGYHIIECTGILDWEGGRLDDASAIPSDLATELRESVQDRLFSEWFGKFADDAEIVVNPMPEGLPYAKGVPTQGDGGDGGSGDSSEAVTETVVSQVDSEADAGLADPTVEGR